MQLKNNDLIGIIYIILISITGLIPNYGALDRIAPQWLYLSCLNFYGIVYLFSRKDFEVQIKRVFRFKPFIFISIFIVWGLLSYFYSINQDEVIVKFVRWINIPAAILITSTLISKFSFNPIKFIAYIFCLVLVVELFFSYKTYFDIIGVTKYNFSLAWILKGATANKNITAASVLIKIPLIFYLIQNSKSQILKTIYSILIFSTVYLVLILSARASIISIILISISLVVGYLVKLKLNPQNKLFDPTLYIILPFIFSISLFQLQFSNDNSASLQSRVSTINQEDKSVQQRLRYYEHSFNQIISNPLIGAGSGNWKIKSIDYDKDKIKGYIVPYHTHNDFLEFGAELGIPGLLLYLSIFIYSFFILGKRIIYDLHKNDFISISVLILMGGIIYFIDANLNFPHARPVMQIPFIIYISMLFYSKSLKNENL